MRRCGGRVFVVAAVIAVHYQAIRNGRMHSQLHVHALSAALHVDNNHAHDNPASSAHHLHFQWLLAHAITSKVGSIALLEHVSITDMQAFSRFHDSVTA
jgi:hypothetical protein